MDDDITEETEQLQHLLALRNAIADGENEPDMNAVAEEIEQLQRLLALRKEVAEG
jgi:predicted component of type VI protein secretion system